MRPYAPPLLAGLAAALCCALAPGCHTGSSNTIAGAAIMTGLAGGASAYKRSTGDCYVDCLPGTRCNRQSGLCEALPCRDKCGPNEGCEETVTGIRCLPASGLAVQSNKGAQVPKSDTSAPAPRSDGKVSAPAAAVAPAMTPKPKPSPEESQPGPTPAPFPVPDPNTPSPSPQMDKPRQPPPR